MLQTNYRRNAERMQLKYAKGRRKKVLTFSQGDFVSLRIPRIDRSSTDAHRLPCVVVERLGSKFHFYRLRCSHGVLKQCFGEGDLELFKGDLDIPVDGWEESPIISLREASQKNESFKRISCRTLQLQDELQLKPVFLSTGGSTMHIEVPQGEVMLQYHL